MLRACAFETDRLLVKEWHSLACSEWHPQDLDALVASMLTEPVTRSLPPAWQGTYTTGRAREWVEERDAEGATLLVIGKVARQPLGLMILFEQQERAGTGGIDVRLGYLLAEDAWGQGIASELLAGFLRWCRGQPSLATITGGVGRDNPASARVLEKNGFQPVETADATTTDEQLYRLSLG